ncbi:cytochrome P450 [Mycena filopes]|nr:cytochrome P450 [Mycena filopes]
MTTTDSKSWLLYGIAAGALSVLWLSSRKKSPIPALVGSKGVLSSYGAAVNVLRNATEVITEGYYSGRDGVYRFPTLFRWDYIAYGKKRLLEIGSAPEHILSFQEGVAEGLQIRFTMGAALTDNPYHVSAIRSSLTRNLARCFPEVRDEIVHSFSHILGESKEWKLIEVLPTTMQVVARTSNRLFVGRPLCRDPEYLQLNIDYTVTIFTRGQMIALFPTVLKPFVAPLLSTRKSSLRHALKFLGPILEDRLEKETQYGRDWVDRPNDLISWLLDLAEESERTAPALALRILATNMAAIHTSSTTLTAALYDLAAHPEHFLPMREEAERVVATEGWTKVALNNMYKIDSFLRESQRLNGSGPIAMTRRVVAKDGFTFSDGTKVPFGAFISVPGTTTHYDQGNYENAETFDGFRFSRARELQHNAKSATAAKVDDPDADEGSFFNRHMVSTAPDHVVFGHGRHACPGRFFAATELKAMLAHLLINYDVKAETEGVRPPDMVFGMLRMPGPKGRIWVRRRSD